MAEQLGNIVLAATAAGAGAAWVSGLPFRRRPGRRPCPVRIAVFRLEVPAQIEWRCTSCGEDGVITGWEHTHFDLRAPGSDRRHGVVTDVVVSHEVATALRDLRLIDSECERLVYRGRPVDGGVVLTADDPELEDLNWFVAAEANHESIRWRQQRLDAALTVLDEALHAMAF